MTAQQVQQEESKYTALGYDLDTTRPEDKLLLDCEYPNTMSEVLSWHTRVREFRVECSECDVVWAIYSGCLRGEYWFDFTCPRCTVIGGYELSVC